MRIGLFLDFDGVLTPKPVNMQFASMLSIDQSLNDLEVKYASGVIDNAGFNRKFIPLFRGANFSRQFVEQRSSSIQLDTYASDIVREPNIQVHLVTSSPSFYVDLFARKFQIARPNYICSEYTFDSDGLLESCNNPCGVREKEAFVRKAASSFELTIGVGDSDEQDGQFLAHCNIKILMGIGARRRDYLRCDDLFSLLELVRSIKKQGMSYRESLLPQDCKSGIKRLLKKTPFEQNVFIITPFESDARYKSSIVAIKKELEDAGYFGYLASDMNLQTDLWANVRAFMHGCKYGVALMTAHEVEGKGTVKIADRVLNPNVVAEVGYMMGAGKEVLLLKDSRVAALPTDWLGKLYKNINLKDPEDTVRQAMTQWVKQLPR